MNNYNDLPLRQKERVRVELYNIASKFCEANHIYTTNRGYWWTTNVYLEKATLVLTKNNPEVEFPPEQSGLEIRINLKNTQEKNVSLQKYLEHNEVKVHLLKME